MSTEFMLLVHRRKNKNKKKKRRALGSNALVKIRSFTRRVLFNYLEEFKRMTRKICICLFFFYFIDKSAWKAPRFSLSKQLGI